MLSSIVRVGTGGCEENQTRLICVVNGRAPMSELDHASSRGNISQRPISHYAQLVLKTGCFLCKSRLVRLQVNREQPKDSGGSMTPHLVQGLVPDAESVTLVSYLAFLYVSASINWEELGTTVARS